MNATKWVFLVPDEEDLFTSALHFLRKNAVRWEIYPFYIFGKTSPKGKGARAGI